jgi:hypothetical protein
VVVGIVVDPYRTAAGRRGCDHGDPVLRGNAMGRILSLIGLVVLVVLLAVVPVPSLLLLLAALPLVLGVMRPRRRGLGG